MVSSDSCGVYASIRVSASLGHEALWWRVWLADRSPALHAAFRVMVSAVVPCLVPRVVQPFSRPRAWI